jgi:RES domain-containing protein
VKLWRLVRPGHEALDGEGARRLGGRYASAGRPIVPFASEAALAVLIAMRYVEPDGEAWQAEYRLGWTQSDALPERLPERLDDAGKTAWVDAWAQGQRSLLAALPSAVLPEGMWC